MRFPIMRHKQDYQTIERALLAAEHKLHAMGKHNTAELLEVAHLALMRTDSRISRYIKRKEKK